MPAALSQAFSKFLRHAANAGMVEAQDFDVGDEQGGLLYCGHELKTGTYPPGKMYFAIRGSRRHPRTCAPRRANRELASPRYGRLFSGRPKAAKKTTVYEEPLAE
jgi:hypothetical protein